MEMVNEIKSLLKSTDQQSGDGKTIQINRKVNPNPFMKKDSGIKPFNMGGEVKIKNRKIVSLMKPFEMATNNNKNNNNNDDDDDDDYIQEMRQEIKTLEKRIENLQSLKESLLAMREVDMNHDTNDNLIQAVKSVQQSLNHLNDKLTTNQRQNGVISNEFENGATETIRPDGVRILKFPNGQIEKVFENGAKQIIYPDGKQRLVRGDKSSEQIILTDGTIYTVYSNGIEQIQYLNGDLEIRTETYVKRKYANGKIKTIYSNGFEETIFNNGRLRFKNADGDIVFDKICHDHHSII